MKLKTLGLECMVTIMRSLVDWSKELRLTTESASVIEETVGTSQVSTPTKKPKTQENGGAEGDSSTPGESRKFQ